MKKYIDLGGIFEQIKNKINALKKEKTRTQRELNALKARMKSNSNRGQKLTYKLSRLTINESALNRKRKALEGRMEKIDDKLHRLEKIVLDAKKGGV